MLKRELLCPMQLLIFIFLFSAFCFGAIRNIQDNYQLIYHVINLTGDHVGSQVANLSIKKISNISWYDFDDNSFKTSGFGNNTTALTEDSVYGYYYYTFNPPATETVAEEYLFLIHNDNTTYGDHQSISISYQNIGNSDFDYSSNQVIVVTNNDKTGYSISGTITTLDTLATQGDSNWTTATGFSTHAAADIWSVGARALTDKTGFSLSAASIDSIWDELQSGHTTSGSFGKYLDTEISGITVSVSDADIDKIWDELKSGHTTAGSFGYYLDSQISGITASISDADIDKIWDEILADHLTANTTGKKLSEMPTPYSTYP